jgi:hypothetical protein
VVVTWQDVEVRNEAPATTRRAFLRGVAGLAVAGATLAGCDLFGGGGDGTPDAEQPKQVLDFLTSTNGLADRYDATITAVPALATTLTPIRDAHRAHVKALATALGTTAPAAGAPATRPPTDGPSAMAALVAAEKAGRDDAVAVCLAAAPRYAPLLGSIAAARATHLEVMT